MSDSPEPKRLVGGLGRGLSALLPPSETAQNLREIALDDIAPNPRQPREEFDHAALEELAASIRAVGVLQPVVVRRHGNGYQLVMGERRVRAARLAGLDRIPALVRDTGDSEMLRDALIENLQRQDLNPIEEADAFRLLIDEFALRHEDLAERVGRSRAAVTNSLRLLSLAPSVRERIVSGSLSAAHGRALAGLADEQTQERIARRISAESLSVRATEELVRRLQAGAAGAAGHASTALKPERTAGILEVEKRLSDMLDTRVRIERSRRRGRIVVEFADEADLDRIWRIVAGER